MPDCNGLSLRGEIKERVVKKLAIRRSFLVVAFVAFIQEEEQ